MHDNFFAAGGQSLIAAQLVARLRETFHIDLPLRALFDHPTISSLSEEIQNIRRLDRYLARPALRASHDRKFPLSVAQEQIWRLQRALPESSFFHIPLAFRLTGSVDLPSLEWAFTQTVRRHPALRTTFDATGEQPVQVVANPSTFALRVADLTSLPDGTNTEAVLSQVLVKETTTPFQLATGPLFRALLIRLDSREHVLVLTVHHVVADGHSVGILCDEIASEYAAHLKGDTADLPELPVQYGDFAIWEAEWRQSEAGAADLKYWQRRLSGEWPALTLPGTRPMPLHATFRYAERQMILDESRPAPFVPWAAKRASPFS